MPEWDVRPASKVCSYMFVSPFRSHLACSVALHCQSVAVVNVCFDKDVLKEQNCCSGWLSSSIGFCQSCRTGPIGLALAWLQERRLRGAGYFIGSYENQGRDSRSAVRLSISTAKDMMLPACSVIKWHAAWQRGLCRSSLMQNRSARPNLSSGHRPTIHSIQ